MVEAISCDQHKCWPIDVDIAGIYLERRRDTDYILQTEIAADLFERILLFDVIHRHLLQPSR